MRKERASWSSGFTIVEVAIVASILAVLFSLGTMVLNSFVRRDEVAAEAKKIESIINEAKIKTLAGFSLGGGQAYNFGVYFEANQYILYPGLTYDPQNANNQKFLLPDTLEIVPVFLPSNSIVFEKLTGRVRGYNPSQNYLVLREKKSNQRKKISVNQLGVVKIEDQ